MRRPDPPSRVAQQPVHGALDIPQLDHQSAFEAGLALILSGLVQKVERAHRCTGAE